jgi:hypothetical protein
MIDSLRAFALKYQIALIIILVAIIGAGAIAIKVLRGQVAAAQLAELNAKAAADSTRDVEMSKKDSIKLLGDSLRAVEQLAVQERMKADAFDRATKRQTEALIAATLVIERVSGLIGSSDTVRSSRGDSMRFAKFHERREPFTLDAEASLPRSGRAILSYTIAVDTARAELRLGCSAPERGKLVRAATASAITADWLKLRFDRVQQSPEICANSPIAKRAVKPRLGIGFGYGASLIEREIRHGPQLTAGIFVSY